MTNEILQVNYQHNLVIAQEEQGGVYTLSDFKF